MKIKKTFAAISASVFMLSASNTLAADPLFGGNTVTAKPTVQMSNMTMTVTGPDGYFSKEFSSQQAPFLSLQKGGGLKDGLYKWELTGATSERVQANPMGLDYGRGDSARQYVNKSVTESGSFRVVSGVIVTSDKGVAEIERIRETRTHLHTVK